MKHMEYVRIMFFLYCMENSIFPKFDMIAYHVHHGNPFYAAKKCFFDRWWNSNNEIFKMSPFVRAATTTCTQIICSYFYRPLCYNAANGISHSSPPPRLFNRDELRINVVHSSTVLDCWYEVGTFMNMHQYKNGNFPELAKITKNVYVYLYIYGLT